MEVQRFVERKESWEESSKPPEAWQTTNPSCFAWNCWLPHLLQAPCYQKPPWISSSTPPGSMCQDGRTISLLNESLNHCHFSPKKKVVCFLQTNGSPEVNSSFIWSHPSWEILLVMFRPLSFFVFFNKAFFLWYFFIFSKVKNILVCTQSEKYWTFQNSKPSWLNIPVVCSQWPKPRTQFDRLSCHPLSVRARTKRASACHQIWL